MNTKKLLKVKINVVEIYNKQTTLDIIGIYEDGVEQNLKGTVVRKGDTVEIDVLRDQK